MAKLQKSLLHVSPEEALFEVIFALSLIEHEQQGLVDIARYKCKEGTKIPLSPTAFCGVLCSRNLPQLTMHNTRTPWRHLSRVSRTNTHWAWHVGDWEFSSMSNHTDDKCTLIAS